MTISLVKWNHGDDHLLGCLSSIHARYGRAANNNTFLNLHYIHTYTYRPCRNNNCMLETAIYSRCIVESELCIINIVILLVVEEKLSRA